MVWSSVSNKSHDGSQSSERDKTLVLSEMSEGNILSVLCCLLSLLCKLSYLEIPRVSGSSNKTKEEQALVSQQTTVSSDTAVRISVQYLSSDCLEAVHNDNLLNKNDIAIICE